MKIQNLSALTAFIVIAVMSMTAKAQYPSPIAFGSDVHAHWDYGVTEYSTPHRGLYNLNSFMSSWEYCSFVGLVGDHVRKSKATSAYEDPHYNLIQPYTLSQLQSMDYTAVENVVTGVPLISTQGNHDLPASDPYGPTFNASTGSYSVSTSPYAHIFTISTDDFTNVYYVLAYYLSSWSTSSDGKIVIIMSHYSLHTLHDVNQSAANDIFDLIQGYSSGDDPLDIVFVWGHTHGYKSSNVLWDKHTKMITPPGQIIATCANKASSDGTLNDNAFETLNFTSLNAGYVGNPDLNSSSYAGKMSLVTTYPESYYGERIWVYRIAENTWYSILRRDPDWSNWF